MQVDLKLYAGSVTNIKYLMGIAEIFSKDICMNFGLEKCRTQIEIRGAHVTTGKVVKWWKLWNKMKYINTWACSKTIRIPNLLIKKTRVQKHIAKQYITLFKRNLASKIQLKPQTNTYAMPILSKTFNLIKRSKTETDEIERSTKTMLTRFRAHRPKSAIERKTIFRRKGGRRLVNLQK